MSTARVARSDGDLRLFIEHFARYMRIRALFTLLLSHQPDAPTHPSSSHMSPSN